MKHYEIMRPFLWFAKTEKVSIDKFKEYFTEKAIRDLLEYGYIKVLA